VDAPIVPWTLLGMACSVRETNFCFGREWYFVQTSKVDADLVWIASTLMMRIDTAVFAEKVLSDLFVPFVRQQRVCAGNQAERTLVLSFHQNSLLLAKRAIATIYSARDIFGANLKNHLPAVARTLINFHNVNPNQYRLNLLLAFS
jgi:hypothetical protein